MVMGRPSTPTSTNVDDDVDLDSSVDLDGSEAIRGRLTPPSTSPVVELRRGSQHRIGRRPASRVGSTLRVNDQVDVDDHERHIEDL
jgi:hypothetical protein